MNREEYAHHLINLRTTKTDPMLIKEREGKGKKTFKYVTKHTAYRWLDMNYPGSWGFKVSERFYDEKFKQYYVMGKIKIKDPVTGFIREFEDIGISENKVKVSTGEDVEQMHYKNAVSDCFKRCAVVAGAFNDVYSEDDEGFKDAEDIDYTKIFKHIDKGLIDYDANQIVQQLFSVKYGLLNESDIMEAWGVT